MKKIFLSAMVTVFALTGATRADVLANYNGDYVTANTNCLSSWSMTTPRSPDPAGYTGPVFYGGFTNYSNKGLVFRITENTTQDYINAQVSGISNAVDVPGAMVIMFTNSAMSWTGVVAKVGAFSFTTQTNWFRYVARDSDGSFYISDAAYYGSVTTNAASAGSLTWYSYSPATHLYDDQLGSPAAWSPLSVTAAGIFVGSRNVTTNNGSIGGRVYQFYATGDSGIQYSLTVNANPGGSATGGGIFAAGANPQITATPSNGFYWVSWTGAVTSANSTTNVYMSTNKTVWANFFPIPVKATTFTLE